MAGRKSEAREKLKFNVLFIAFSGEEMGLLGSKAFMENPTIPQESMLAMINLDMVGRLNPKKPSPSVE
ncbi:MAG: M28 family peptidase [Saprospiraceae bacterium]|nr:M28 family peptidase [Saprospiraceae bacterium]